MMATTSVFGAFGLIGALFSIALAILWILVPFAIFGVKPLLRELITEQRKTQALLVEIGKNASAGERRT